MPQLQSALLCLPTELRHEIYSYLLPTEVHVRLHDGNFCVSACVQRARSFSPFSQFDVHPWDYAIQWTDSTWRKQVSTPVYARRLQSAWGLHWSCEEHTSFSEGAENPSLLSVCKSVRNEVYDLLAHTSIVHVSDLNLIDNWARASEMAISSPAQFAKMPVENVSRLSITLKLPLGFFQSVERISDNDSTCSDTDLATQQASQWQRLGSSLSRFKALKKLDLWLDHTEPQFWAMVNERSTLDSLFTQLNGHPNLDVTVTLPMLHPKFEQDERHYIDEEISPKIISPNVRIHRVLRQKRYAVVDGATGDVKIVKKYDFPFMYDEYLGLGLGMSLAEMAKRERGEWKQGRNMENEAARARFFYGLI